MQLRKENWKKNQDFNGVLFCDLAITGVMLYQLSYEATDAGSRSIDSQHSQPHLVPMFLSDFKNH